MSYVGDVLACRFGRCFCLRQRCPPDTRTAPGVPGITKNVVLQYWSARAPERRPYNLYVTIPNGTGARNAPLRLVCYNDVFAERRGRRSLRSLYDTVKKRGHPLGAHIIRIQFLQSIRVLTAHFERMMLTTMSVTVSSRNSGFLKESTADLPMKASIIIIKNFAAHIEVMYFFGG